MTRRLAAIGIFAVACAVWGTFAVSGLVYLWNYENTPGLAAHPPDSWPAGSEIVRAQDRPTLVVAAHPQCPCTRASIGELAEVLARVSVRPKTVVLFIRPAAFEEGWEQTALWRRAAALPDTTVVADLAGVEADRFGAATSGQTLLYDEAGRLQFSGGITGARGHSGDNAGRAELIKLLEGDADDGEPTKVFGCPLFADKPERM